MKRLILISASFIIASAAIAQSDNTLYRFDNAGTATEVRTLGSAPEFPFLRNMTSSRQVYAAIKKHENDNSMAMNKLNDLLMQVGYANGAKDLEANDISEAWLEPGTEGNMGSRGYTYGYYRLAGDKSEFRAWKIAANDNANSNQPLYLFAKCGNAFFPKDQRTACITVPVSVTPDMTQVALTSSGTKVTNTDQTFVYYAKKRGKKSQGEYPVAGINDKYPSKPIMLTAKPNVTVSPETYTVSVSAPQQNVSACTDATLNLAANINVEKTSAYTGNYPNSSDHKSYTKVSKRTYKMTARRMNRIERKGHKIERRIGVPVVVSTDKA